MYEHDERIVMTLDAGGTNFVFSAIQGCREISVLLSPGLLTMSMELLVICLTSRLLGEEWHSDLI